MADFFQVQNLKKYFKTPGGMLHAVDNVTFSIEKGKTMGVVGESGCGKSTLGRVVIGLLDATDGQVLMDGENILAATGRRKKEFRRDLQLVFQDPYSSLNPRMCVSELIAEPLKVYKVYPNKNQLQNRVFELMDTVGLARRLAFSYPHELDGGRRQRIGIARALSLNPKFIVCDEPVSSLDVSIQAQILNLLEDLQKEHGLTYIFITHDLSVVRHISDEIMVMYLGTLVEKSDARGLFKTPLHPYTRGLLSAIPIPKLRREKKRVLLQGELSSPVEPPPGCRFANRCTFATAVCRQDDPLLIEDAPGHFVACHNLETVKNS